MSTRGRKPVQITRALHPEGVPETDYVEHVFVFPNGIR